MSYMRHLRQKALLLLFLTLEWSTWSTCHDIWTWILTVKSHVVNSSSFLNYRHNPRMKILKSCVNFRPFNVSILMLDIWYFFQHHQIFFLLSGSRGLIRNQLSATWVGAHEVEERRKNEISPAVIQRDLSAFKHWKFRRKFIMIMRVHSGIRLPICQREIIYNRLLLVSDSAIICAVRFVTIKSSIMVGTFIKWH